MERGDLIKVNGPIFVGQGQALSEVAADDVRVAVVNGRRTRHDRTRHLTVPVTGLNSVVKSVFTASRSNRSDAVPGSRQVRRPARDSRRL